jgi:hypothetical protein
MSTMRSNKTLFPLFRRALPLGLLAAACLAPGPGLARRLGRSIFSAAGEAGGAEAGSAGAAAAEEESELARLRRQIEELQSKEKEAGSKIRELENQQKEDECVACMEGLVDLSKRGVTCSECAVADCRAKLCAKCGPKCKTLRSGEVECPLCRGAFGARAAAVVVEEGAGDAGAQATAPGTAEARVLRRDQRRAAEQAQFDADRAAERARLGAARAERDAARAADVAQARNRTTAFTSTGGATTFTSGSATVVIHGSVDGSSVIGGGSSGNVHIYGNVRGGVMGGGTIVTNGTGAAQGHTMDISGMGETHTLGRGCGVEKLTISGTGNNVTISEGGPSSVEVTGMGNTVRVTGSSNVTVTGMGNTVRGRNVVNSGVGNTISGQ